LGDYGKHVMIGEQIVEGDCNILKSGAIT